MTRFLLGIFLSLILVSCSHSKSLKKEEAATEEKNAPLVEMSRDAQSHVNLQVAHATMTELREYLEALGTVRPIDSRIGRIQPLARGRLRDILVRVGDRVASGQPLAHFDNMEAGEILTQYHETYAERERLRAQQAAATKQMERDSHLADIGAVPQKQLETSQAEQQSLEEEIKAKESTLEGLTARLRRFGITGLTLGDDSIATIRSSFAGVVIKADASPGQVVDTGSELFQIADLSEVWVQAEVYEKDIARVQAGQLATVLVDSYPGQRFEGKVTYVGDILDPQTRTVKVRCEVPNPGTKLKLDMFASVSLPTTFSKRALTVPVTAVQQVEDDKVVFVQRDSTHFEKRIVQLGKTVGDLIEITSGLQKEEKVVSEGAFFVKSELLKKQLGGEE